MKKTIAQLNAEIRKLNSDLKNTQSVLDTLYKANEGLAGEVQEAKSEVKKLKSDAEVKDAANKSMAGVLNDYSDELARRSRLKPADAIFEILHTLELPEQVSVINQVSAIKAVTLRKLHSEAAIKAQYLSNVLSSHETNMANIANGTTVQP